MEFASINEQAVWVASFDEDAFIRVNAMGASCSESKCPAPRHCLCSRRPGAAETLLPECSDLARTAPARQSSARIDVVEVEIPGAGYP